MSRSAIARWGLVGLPFGLWSCGAAAPCAETAARSEQPPASAKASVSAAASAAAAAARPTCPIWYADVASSAAALPARFEAPIPTDDAAVVGWRLGANPDGPPQAYLRDGLCHGDTDAWQRLGAAATRLAEKGASAQVLQLTLSSLVNWCGDEQPAFCEMAREQLSQAQGEAAQSVPLEALEYCHDEATAQLMAASWIPGAAYIDWHRHQPFADSPRLREAVRDTIARGALSDISQAAGYLLDHNVPDAGKFLLALHAKQRDAERRASIGVTLGDVPGGKAAYKAGCAMLGEVSENFYAMMYCHGAETRRSLLREATAAESCPPTDVVRQYSENWARKERAFGADEVAEMAKNLESCVESDEKRRVPCLSALAAVAPQRGQALAARYLQDQDGSLRELAVAITRYPDNEAFARALTSLGLRATARPASPGEPRARAAYLLDRVQELRVDFAGVHQSPALLLYDLRRQLPGLEALRFEEEPSGRDKPHRYFAYDGQTRYEVKPGASPKAVNVVQLLGFINTLARARGLPDRVAAMAETRWDGPWSLSFVFGSERALCELDRSALLRLARVPEPWETPPKASAAERD